MSDVMTAAELDGPPPSGSSKHATARRVLAIVMVVLILVLMVSCYLVYRATRLPGTKSQVSAEKGGLTWVRSIYGISNTPAGLFGQTQAAVPDKNGTIWVTDVMNRSSLMGFSPEGRFLGRLESQTASMPLEAPSRFAFGPDGRVYICETTLDRIRVLTPDGKEAGSFNVPKPVSIAVSDDRILVGAVSGFAVLEKDGKPLGVFGSRGKGPDQYDYVHGVAFGPDGSMYVADSYNNRLQAYNADGTRRWIKRTGSPTNSASVKNNMLATSEATDTALKGTRALQLPLGLTVDGAGRIVVADMYECALAVFDPKSGKLLAKYGEPGTEDGQFFYPVSVSYDPGRDWFTVADAINNRVQVVRIPGSGGGAGAAANRLLAGPWRACILPLLLLLLAIAIYVAQRVIRRRREMAEDETVLPEGA